MTRLLSLLGILAALSLTSACGGFSQPSGDPANRLSLGYFANVTHAGPVYGVASGIYQEELGSTKLKTQVFNAGPAAVEALFAGAIDAAYLGPGPAVNAFLKSRGDFVVVAGATSGGTSLVVKPEITNAAQLKGKRIADPQRGGTQDIALRTFLKGKGYREDRQGGGDVTIISQDNSQTLAAFKKGDIDGGWVPEPWASRLVLEAGGTVLVDEKTLWPQGKFVTTNLVVKKSYVQQHPQTVKALLTAQVRADREVVANPAKAQNVVNAALKQLTGKSLKPEVIARAFTNITLSEEPLAATLQQAAQHSFDSGLVKPGSLKGIYDLRLLDEVLGKHVDDAGLGKG